MIVLLDLASFHFYQPSEAQAATKTQSANTSRIFRTFTLTEAGLVFLTALFAENFDIHITLAIEHDPGYESSEF